MSPFQHVLGFAVVVLALAIADLAQSVHRLLRNRDRVRWDPLPILVVVFVLLELCMTWWIFFWMGVEEEYAPIYDFVFSPGGFIVFGALLVITYLVVAAVLPDDVPEEGIDLREYYEGNARYFWSLYALSWAVESVLLVQILPDEPGLEIVFGLVLLAIMMLAMLVLTFVRRRWVHWVVVGALTVMAAQAWFRNADLTAGPPRPPPAEVAPGDGSS